MLLLEWLAPVALVTTAGVVLRNKTERITAQYGQLQREALDKIERERKKKRSNENVDRQGWHEPVRNHEEAPSAGQVEQLELVEDEPL